MSDPKLFSRRQILALFGGATGLAITGAQAQQDSTNGNLLAGTSDMAQAYQVGEGTYKGPLSVRSEVPQEDGITFIQTDAGTNGEQFSLHHYNGGWSRQGMDLPTLDTEEVGFDDPDGQEQFRLVPVDPDNPLQDIDGGSGGFSLDNGVLVQKSDENDSTGLSRWTWGRNVTLGVRKNNTVNGEPAGTSEWLKNPADASFITLENDYSTGNLRFETQRGGGHVFYTDDGSASDQEGSNKTKRFHIIDTESAYADIEAQLLDNVSFSLNQFRFYEVDSDPRGGNGRYGIFAPNTDTNTLRLSFGGGTEFAIRPGFSEVARFLDGGARIQHENGTTADRPSDPQTGQEYFDTDLGQPIWYDGTDWVDATGSVV